MPLFRKEIIVVITAVVTFAFLSILESFSYFQTDGNISDLKFLEDCSLKSWTLSIRRLRRWETIKNQEAFDRDRWNEDTSTLSEVSLHQWARKIHEKRFLYPPHPKSLDLSKKYIIYRLYHELGLPYEKITSALSGMIMEAQSLNRTIVLSPLIVSPHQNGGKIQIKDFEFYFNKEKVLEMTGVIDEAEFFGRYKRSLINGQIVTWEFRRSLSFDSPSGLVGVKQTVLERDFYFQEESTASHLWFQKEYERRRWRVPPAPHLVKLAEKIVLELPDVYFGLEIWRPDKFDDPQRWPNLMKDTSFPFLVEKLLNFIPVHSTIFISTNELQNGYFNDLKKTFVVKMLKDFEYIEEIRKVWTSEVSRLSNGDDSLENFDALQRAAVQKLVFEKAAKKVKTFNDLTVDKEEGLPPPSKPRPYVQVTTDQGPFVFTSA